MSVELTETRGNEEWRLAHRRKIDASDARVFMAKAGTKRWHGLIERLVLDFEGIPQHTDSHPDPWAEQHEVDIRVAIAAYRRETGAEARIPGLIGHDVLSWLVCSPHGITADAVVWTRTRRTARVFHVEHGRLSRSDRARARLTAWVCDRPRCDVVDVWVPGGGLPDRLSVTVEETSQQWVSEIILPRLTAVWRDVSQRLVARR